MERNYEFVEVKYVFMSEKAADDLNYITEKQAFESIIASSYAEVKQTFEKDVIKSGAEYAIGNAIQKFNVLEPVNKTKKVGFIYKCDNAYEILLGTFLAIFDYVFCHNSNQEECIDCKAVITSFKSAFESLANDGGEIKSSYLKGQYALSSERAAIICKCDRDVGELYNKNKYERKKYYDAWRYAKKPTVSVLDLFVYNLDKTIRTYCNTRKVTQSVVRQHVFMVIYRVFELIENGESLFASDLEEQKKINAPFEYLTLARGY